jgi:hypothetical protein
MMHESLVRASVVHYVRDWQGEAAAERETQRQVERHFLCMPPLVGLLGEYEAGRDRYPDFASFFPRVVAFFNEIAPTYARQGGEESEAAPKVISLQPPNGATNIDPNLSEIVVTFDRPMQGGYSFVGGGPNYPETLGKPAFSPDRKTITLKVKLKPAWRYEFWLNRGRFDSFRSEDGVALDPVHVEFRTSE